MKVGIVVPYSWSFGGGVVDHAEAQARALEAIGVETRLLIGHDPPGSFSRILHPRQGRPGPPPPRVIPLGRSVIVPGNGALSNLVLSPHALPQLRRALARERFDLVHVHEPLAPMLSPAALALWDGPAVATFHAAGDSSWRRLAEPLWGFLLDRIDLRVAVSEQARLAASPFAPGHYEVIPNGVELEEGVDPAGRGDRIVFLGRHDPRKGLPVLLRAWPQLRGSGVRLRVIGADPLAVRLLLTRLRVAEEGIDVLGFVSDEELTQELSTAKLLVAPSLGNESFGMVITRAFACALPVVASDIPGYREVVDDTTGALTPPDDPDALAETVAGLLADEPARVERGRAARERAETRYAWPLLARRLADCYEQVLAGYQA
ncbi:MAG TPA: glycosyltransferase family 4 protein [Gaiellaceae bacterium]|nr:glycosyltransferase family 4 protein [Gaiellaceae bacterium]